ncbi:MAG: glycosyltransferase family 39 protein [Thermoanaerobaculia bacterium]
MWRERAGLFAIFGLSMAVVDPRGSFPLCDDWNFALATWHFARTGSFVFSRYTAMSLRAQAVWGAVWTLLFGQSYEVLRFSTLVLSFGCVLLAHGLLRRLGVGPTGRIIGALVFLFHPIFFWASYTYMTHIPFLFAALLGVYLFYRGMTEDRVGFMIGGGVAVMAAYFVRQTGVAVAVPAVLMLLWQRDRLARRWKILLVGPVLSIVVFGPLFLFTDLLSGYPHQIDIHIQVWNQGLLHSVIVAFSNAIHYTAVSFQYSTLFVLPLTVLVIGRGRINRKSVLWLALLVIPFLWVASGLVGARAAIPWPGLGSVFTNLGLGPMTLRDVWILGLPYPIHLGYPARIAVTYVTAVAGTFMVYRLGRAFGRASFGFQLLTLQCVLGLAALVPSDIYFDRYVLDSLWPLPFLLVLIIPLERTLAKAIATSLLTLVAFFSIAATHDYLAWNRARWQAFDRLQSEGVTLAQLEGGYEINQYLLGGFNGTWDSAIVDDEYILAFNPVEGYRIVFGVPYRRLLGGGMGVVLAERRIGPSPRAPLDVKRKWLESGRRAADPNLGGVARSPSE